MQMQPPTLTQPNAHGDGEDDLIKLLFSPSQQPQQLQGLEQCQEQRQNEGTEDVDMVQE